MGGSFEVQGVRSQPSQTENLERSPRFVALATLLTLGLYAYRWLWQTSKEASRFDQHRPSPFAVIRWAMPAWIVGLLGSLAVILFLLAPAGPPPNGSMPLAYTLGGISLAGSIGLMVGGWRLLRLVQANGEAIEDPDALQPGVLLVVLLLSSLVPLLSLLAVTFVLYKTQGALNRIADAAGRGYQPTEDPSQGAGRVLRQPDDHPG